MLLVRENIDYIVNSCFSPQDIEILEFEQNGTRITIKDQFLYHYATACFTGTLEELSKSIMYKIFQHQDLLLKIKDYRENIRRILDLGEYSKVTLGYKDQIGSETNIGASGIKTETETKHVDQYAGADQTDNININDDRTALSQTNAVKNLGIVIPQPSLSPTTENMEIYSMGENQIEKQNKEITRQTLNNPQHEEGGDPIGYQNLTKDISTSQSNNTNITTSSRGSESKSDNKSRTTTTNTKGTKLDEINRSVEFITNDARLRI